MPHEQDHRRRWQESEAPAPHGDELNDPAAPPPDLERDAPEPAERPDPKVRPIGDMDRPGMNPEQEGEE